MDAFLELLLRTALLVWSYMTAWFLVAVVARRNDIADVAWGLGFVLIAWWLAVTAPDGLSGLPARQWLVSGLVTVWGLRLAAHIWLRNRGGGEDFRYAEWRREWGRWFLPRTYLQVFVLQGLFMVLISTPVVAVAADPGGDISWLGALGMAIWVIGFAFEAIGDRQLSRFKADPANRGHVMRSGLWRYTRHPNYFGEVACWWGVWLLSLSSAAGWAAVVGPVTITVLLLKVSGIPMLERKHEGEPEFEDYKRTTSAFFPLPPRSDRAV